MMQADGLNEVISDFTKAGLLAGVRAEQVLSDAGRDIQETARQLAPKTGLPHYARTITHETYIDGDAVTVEVGPERGGQGSLAHILEFGTSRTPPHAHLGPALDRHAPGAVKRLADVLGEF